MNTTIHRRLLPVLLLPALFLAGGTAMAIEEPAFEVVRETGGIEIRRYASFIVAETLVEEADSRDAASSEGFRRLFGYISGDNRAREKIEMTAPVIQAGAKQNGGKGKGEKITMTVPVQQVATDTGWLVAFVLPLNFTMATAPLPADPRVSLREVAPRTVAVLRFSGRWTDANIEKHRQELLDKLEQSGARLLGDVEFAAYNAPFALPFLRRNEVMVEIDGVHDARPG
jgi:hypothetical protein